MRADRGRAGGGDYTAGIRENSHGRGSRPWGASLELRTGRQGLAAREPLQREGSVRPRRLRGREAPLRPDLLPRTASDFGAGHAEWLSDEGIAILTRQDEAGDEGTRTPPTPSSLFDARPDSSSSDGSSDIARSIENVTAVGGVPDGGAVAAVTVPQSLRRADAEQAGASAGLGATGERLPEEHQRLRHRPLDLA
jgi:hypothetical protein